MTPVLRYVVIWLVLLGLTAATFGLSHVKLGDASIVVALGIAALKSILVLVFFMHLLHERGASRLVVVTALLFLALAIGLIVGDVATRPPLWVPGQRPTPGIPRSG